MEFIPIQANVTAGADSITVNIVDATADQPMYIDIGVEGRAEFFKGASETFTGLTAGEYEITVGYLGDPSVFSQTRVTVPGTTEGGEQKPDEPTFGNILADIVIGTDSITVTILEATADQPMFVAVGNETRPNLQKGSTETFAGLAPGSYEVTVGYLNDTEGVKRVHSPVTISPAPTPEEEVKQFTVTPVPVENDGAISVVIDNASNREIDVQLLNAEGVQIAGGYSLGNGLVKLGRASAGTYTVRAQYVTPVQRPDGSLDFKTVDTQVIVPEGVTVPPEELKPINIQAKFETGKDYLIVSVLEATDVPMYVALGDLEPKTIHKGGSVRFDGLTPGQTYEIEIDYVNPISGTSPCRGTVTIQEEPKLADIRITGVTAGVNTLTVSGTATAGQQVMIKTTPAAASDAYAVADANGAFSVQIACSAGAYNAVTVQYVADGTKTATATGNWIVTAPVVQPTLSIDSIDTSSTTVSGITFPGIIVEILTGDYAQKVVADDRGVIRFSLPHTYAAGTKFVFTVYYGDGQTFTQEAVVANVPYLGMLKYGDKGEDVRTLTARLKALGYPVSESYRYDSTVREAVRLFQRANGLDDDGIAGPKTQKILFSVSAIGYGSDTYPTLVRGDRDMALIYTLQQRLKDLGYYTIKVDGIFGSGTQRAVRLFQQVNGLSVTGKADHATQKLLYSSSAKPAGDIITGNYQTLSRSSRYKSAVVPMQRRLKKLGYYGGNIDGYFGSQTYRAVRNFQKRNGLSVTGVADPYTQDVLYSSYAKKASSSSSSSSSTGYRLLYWGCRGDAVKRLQNALIDAGYKSIVRTADGIYGQWTYDAVKAYQRNHKLAVDGIAGKNTQNSLYGTKY